MLHGLKLQHQGSSIEVLEAVSRKIWLGAWRVCLLWSLGLGSLFCKQILKEEEKHFLGFPLGGVLPCLGAYILCTLSLYDLHRFGNCLMNISKEVIKNPITSQVIIMIRKISSNLQVSIFSNTNCF